MRILFIGYRLLAGFDPVKSILMTVPPSVVPKLLIGFKNRQCQSTEDARGDSDVRSK